VSCRPKAPVTRTILLGTAIGGILITAASLTNPHVPTAPDASAPSVSAAAVIDPRPPTAAAVIDPRPPAAAASRWMLRTPLPTPAPAPATPAGQGHHRKHAPKPKPKRTPPPAPTGSPKVIAAALVGDAKQLVCFSAIITRESGWQITERNPSSGAYGLPQALPGSKMASAGADWRTNPATQIRWAIGYMHSRYGSPCGAWAFWQTHRWY
jgi:hypothetical protein